MSPKAFTHIGVVIAILLVAGCVSRNSGPELTPNEFIAAKPGIDSRAALLRGADPSLSRDQAIAQANAEYAASAEGIADSKARKEKATQQDFEADLSRTHAPESK